MKKTAVTCLVVALMTVSAAVAQISDNGELEAGRAALQRDPSSAIKHFEKLDSRDGREWLAVALMMESRSPSDAYVERAFASAMRSRIGDAAPSRPELASRLAAGDLVIAFLIGEHDAYAWAFDRRGFTSYQLPPPATISTAVDGARAYADAGDVDGLKRIADDLVPALLGPALDRLPELKRVILVTDGTLDRLPLQTFSESLPRSVAVSKASYSSIVSAITAPTPPPAPARNAVVVIVAAGSALLILVALVSRRGRRRSREQS